MERAHESFLDFVCEQLSPLGEITSRRMFSGYCLYCNGIVFALISGSTLYLKADDGNRRDFERRGLEAFRPFPDRESSMSYYLAPPELFEDSDAALRWGGKAVEAGARAKQKARRKPGAMRSGTKPPKRKTRS